MSALLVTQHALLVQLKTIITVQAAQLAPISMLLRASVIKDALLIVNSVLTKIIVQLV